MAVVENQVSFTVTAADPGGLPVVLSVGDLPQGATFDSSAGAFSWTPDVTQAGGYQITFTATNSAGASSAGSVPIQLGMGNPVITDIRNAASQTQPACSPGTLASLIGGWLVSNGQSVSDPSGGSTQLGGTSVNVNDSPVPVLSASSSRIDFQCPGAAPGTMLTISVGDGVGTSDAVQVAMQGAAPGLFSIDGSGQGQGLVTLTGTSRLVTSRSYLNLGQPAQPGDAITILATGLDNSALPVVKIGNLYVTADSVDALPGTTGVSEINLTVPNGIQEGDAVPLILFSSTLDTALSNTVSIAVEIPRM
jgi:uncharacterized protein (TIGR03437 family)